MKQTEIKTQEQLYAGEGLTAADLGDTLTTAERMAQFEGTIDVDDAMGLSVIMANPEANADLIAGLKSPAAIRAARDLLASAISGQLVDFDIEGHGQAICWLNDREIRLEFRYWCPEEGQDTLDITGAECGPTDGWAKVELTPEQVKMAEAALLPMYVKWLDARTEEGEP